MNVDRNLKNNKTGLLAYFRSRANEIVSELTLQYSAADYKKKASALNKAIIQSRDNLLSILEETARAQNWTNREVLECVLMITYTMMLLCLNLVMLFGSMTIWHFHVE